jgi:hypothetical protein
LALLNGLSESVRQGITNQIKLEAESKTVDLQGLLVIQEHGLTNWVKPRFIQRALKDEAFLLLSRFVWELSPNSRGSEFLATLALKWGSENPESQFAIRSAFYGLQKSGRHSLSQDKLTRLIVFVGDEAVLNSPP